MSNTDFNSQNQDTSLTSMQKRHGNQEVNIEGMILQTQKEYNTTFIEFRTLMSLWMSKENIYEN